MGAPEAGGLLRDLAALPTAVELTAVRRFRQPWEADASLQLRARQPDIAATYWREGRIVESSSDAVFDAAAAAWWADTAAGHRSLIVVDTARDAADVNTRCQHHLMVAGRLGEYVADAADGCRIHSVTSSRPAATLVEIPTSDRQRILNRDVWAVTGVSDDGSLHVKHDRRGASAVLPADYVAADVVLGYATTIAGAQGRTVDRGHVVVTPRTASASLYVGMSRGRDCNHAHVVCDSHDHTEFELGDLTGEQAFAAATQRDPAGQLSAHSVKQRWQTGQADRTTARSRRSQTTPSHRLVDGTPTRTPTRDARRALPAVTTRSSRSSYDSPPTTADDKRSTALRHPSTGARAAPPIGSCSASGELRRGTLISTRHTGVPLRTSDKPSEADVDVGLIGSDVRARRPFECR